MSNWEIKKNVSSYKNLIPPELIEEYQVTEGIFTTYGLDMRILTNMIIDYDCLSVTDKIDVYYDAICLNEDIGYNVIPEANLHGINLFYGDKKYAFHPKVIILRYEHKYNKGVVRYVVSVMSKNITEANLLDAFCLVYGDVEYKDANNGNELAKFVSMLSKIATGDEGHAKIIKELKKVDFKCIDSRVKALEFITQEAMCTEIDSLDDAIIISPFLSDEILRRAIHRNNGSNSIIRVISTIYGYKKISSKLMNQLITKNACYILDEKNTQLHGKIYCGRFGDGEKLIIGSSNATNNGCGVNYKGDNSQHNLELNVVLKFESGCVYKELQSIVDNYGVLLDEENLLIESKEEKEKEDIKQQELLRITKFLKSNLYSVVAEKDNDKWILKVELTMPDSKVYISGDNKIWKCADTSSIALSINEPTNTIMIRGNLNSAQTVYVRIFLYLKDDEDTTEYCRILEEQRNLLYIEIVDKEISRLKKGAVGKSYVSIKKETSDNITRLKYESKHFIYEDLKEIAMTTYNNSKDGYRRAYIEKLEKIKKLIEPIVDKKTEYKALNTAIEIILLKDKE